MQETRRARLQAVILEELAVVVPREVKDPRVTQVTFTRVELAPDASFATIYITILGGAQGGFDGAPPLSEGGAKLRMQDCLDGLRSASGYLRRHLAKILTIRHVPQLQFKEDKGLENTLRVHELLKQIAKEGTTETTAPAGGTSTTGAASSTGDEK